MRGETHTAHVDNDVAVGELGDGLTDDSLAAAESTGDGNGTALDTGEEGIQHTLADDEGLVGGQLLGGGAGHTDGPRLHHGVLCLLAIELDLEDLLLDGVATLGGDLGNDTPRTGREQDAVGVDERVLEDGTPDITAGDVIADLLGGGELPLLLPVERRDGDTAGDIDGARNAGDRLERTLDTVVDVVEEAGA